MTDLRTRSLGLILLTVSAPAFAQINGPIRMPGDRCKEMGVPVDAKTVLTPDQEKSVRCWYEAGNNDAGIRLVQSYLAQKPPAFDPALAVLKVLSKGKTVDPGSIRRRSLSAQPSSDTNIGHGNSTAPATDREASPLAQRILAQLYMAGKGVEADPKKAREWIEKAEKGGDQVARELHQEWLAKGKLMK